ncbi:hypothetical protein PIB30_084475 [Stylosanthes scabra]|uniref:Uncharacterized protein n=1 Tax=Stylosanthes scabra TaxID=79078 RepID=A0ABU6QT82_9FABA|nr:hypothetical protein [Stylosanthes scabra]
MEVDTMDALLSQNKTMAQQLTTLNKKLEKLEISAMGTQMETPTTCSLCGGPHENQHCCLLGDEPSLEQANYLGNQQSSPMIHILTPTIPDGGITLILVGEKTKIQRTTYYGKRKLQINIPFAEALEQMPLYAKFMKDLISK